ncbi:MAG: polysaccharide deacetylase family protein [Clostridia bacterium]|nr:polysaccharide deacetylase family protein [Clostridia bacterium]
MNKIAIKAPVLMAVAVILAAVTVFCAVFGIFMAANRDDDTEKPDKTPDGDTGDGSTDTGNTPGGDENDEGKGDEGKGDEDDPNQNDKPKKYVAFTFDDGPAYHNGLTKKFVNELAKYDGEATFFLIGDRINSATAKNLTYAVEHGWELGIHAFTHKHSFGSGCSDDLYNSEIQKTEDAIHKYLPDYEIKLFRPPYGDLPADRTKESPYAVILWSVDPRDWEYSGESTAEQRDENVQNIVYEVVSNVQDGSIVLMHEIYNNSYLAFCEILKELDKQGYEFVTVSELLGDQLEAGKKFYKR